MAKPGIKKPAAKKKAGNPKPVDWRPIVLAALRRVPVIQQACDVAGIERTTLWRERKERPEFDKAVEDAMQSGIDNAEQEAFRRAVTGFQEPVIHKGELSYLYEPALDEEGNIRRSEQGDVVMKPVLGPDGRPVPLTITKHSDQLLAVILKGRRKEVYSERIEQTGPNGGPIEIDASKRAARVAAILAGAVARKAEASGDNG